MPGYIELPESVVGWTEKAACTSITNCLKAWKLPQPPASVVLQRGKPVYLFLRQPIERFASCYAYFRSRTFPHSTLPRESTLMQFTDYVLDGNFNEHWAPQIEQHTHEGQLVPTFIVRLDAIDKHFPKGYQLGRLNVNHLRDHPEIVYRLKDLEAYYRRDFEEYEAAHR